MSANIDVQLACNGRAIPSSADLIAWARVALGAAHVDSELTLRVVDETESANLNRRYGRGCGATNVLSFTFDAPEVPELTLLGDIVVCAPLVEREADEQGKAARAHWAHLVVHGVLHLLGHDHQALDQAARMEALEKRIIQDLGFPDPYAGEVAE